MTTQPIHLLELGKRPYGQILALQHQLRDHLMAHPDQPGYLITVEHPPTVTLGKRGSSQDLRALESLRNHDVELFAIDRGGEATYHEPGQLIVYPVLGLGVLGVGVVDVIHALAACICQSLAHLHGIRADYDKEHPGVWVEEDRRRAKIASVGMRVSRGVTTHGVAINLSNEMEGFGWIVPCGMPTSPLVSLAQWKGIESEPAKAALYGAFYDDFLARLCEWFDPEVKPFTQQLPPPQEWVTPTIY